MQIRTKTGRVLFLSEFASANQNSVLSCICFTLSPYKRLLQNLLALQADGVRVIVLPGDALRPGVQQGLLLRQLQILLVEFAPTLGDTSAARDVDNLTVLRGDWRRSVDRKSNTALKTDVNKSTDSEINSSERLGTPKCPLE